jgi:prepilin-type N-terminal cleavage/methylation domain-containing protein
MGMIRNRKGLNLIELLITIVILSVGIFPLIHTLSHSVEAAFLQKSKLSAINIAKLQMDVWINQFQLIDHLLDDPAAYPDEFTVVTPDSENMRFNGDFFRVVNRFTKKTDLSNPLKVTYQIDLTVWQIKNPSNEDDPEAISPASGNPGFDSGDEPKFMLSTLYTQYNSTGI